MTAKKRLRRINGLPKAPVELTFCLTASQRGQIEKQYGSKISADAWTLIEGLTRIYLANSLDESTSPHISDMRAALRKVILSVVEAKKIIGDRSSGSISYGLTASLRRIYAEFFNAPEIDLEHSTAMYVVLNHALHAVLASATFVATNLNHEDAQKPEDGSAWQGWIISLTVLFKSEKLPFGVRKDAEGSKGASPFVEFVASLQRQLPSDYRRHSQSIWALSQAIWLARGPGLGLFNEKKREKGKTDLSKRAAALAGKFAMKKSRKSPNG
jgi:hypothetical protein